MENSGFRLISSHYLNDMRIEKGDILREKSSQKTVKVLNVLKNNAGTVELLVEYNAPGSFGVPFQKSPDSFQFLT